MVRKLTEKDNKKVMELVLPEASINLFIIGDIEMYGYDSDFQELWGDFEDNGTLKGILLRYYDSFIVYGKNEFDAAGFAKIIENSNNVTGVSGKESCINLIEPFLTCGFKKRLTYFAECRKEIMKITENKELYESVKCAKPEDARRLADLVYTIDEFDSVKCTDFDVFVERCIKKYEDNAARDYFITENDFVISVAGTAAENSKSAMIVMVCTDKNYRNKGYTTAILSKLLTDLLEEKETVCLFYDNPKAGNIYKRSGFVDIGFWTMLSLINE